VGDPLFRGASPERRKPNVHPLLLLDSRLQPIQRQRRVAGEQIGKIPALQDTEGGRGDRLNGVLDPAQDRRGHPDRVARKYDIKDLTGAAREAMVADRLSFKQRVDGPPTSSSRMMSARGATTMWSVFISVMKPSSCSEKGLNKVLRLLRAPADNFAGMVE